MKIRIKTLVGELTLSVLKNEELDVVKIGDDLDIIAPGSGDATMEVMIVAFEDEGQPVVAPYVTLGASAYLLYKVPYDMTEIERIKEEGDEDEV